MKIMKAGSNENYDLHVLICTNSKEKGQSCGPKGAKLILDHLKPWAKSKGFKGKVRVNASGCLGKCDSGVACVAYPEGEWVLGADPADLSGLEKWIEGLSESGFCG